MPRKADAVPEFFEFKGRLEWRSWLRRNHRRSNGIWVAIQKKGSDKRGIRLKEAVEEAICFGWIDSRIRRIDENYFIQWYSPRKEDSVWSLINKNRAIAMIESGRMRKEGLRSVEAAKRNGKWQIAYSSKVPIKIPNELAGRLRSLGALERFKSLPESLKLQYVFWIAQAKRADTRENRINELIEALVSGRRLE